MSIKILLLLFAALLVVVIGFNIIQQARMKQERERRHEIAKHRAVIVELEQLLAAGPLLPFTNRMVRLLNHRILETIKQILTIEPNSTEMQSRQREMEQLLEKLNKEPAVERGIEGFSPPTNEQQIITLIKVLKRLKDFARLEQSRGAMLHDEFVAESQRADQLMLRINVAVHMDRARQASIKHQVGSARQYLSQLTKLLMTANGDEEFKQAMMAKANEMADELNQRQQSILEKSPAAKAEQQERDDLDELFSPKKKW